MEAEAWREDSARGKERKVATLGRKFESFVVGKLRKSLGGWMSWAKGDWAVSLAGKEYTGGHLRPDITPIPSIANPKNLKKVGKVTAKI